MKRKLLDILDKFIIFSLFASIIIFILYPFFEVFKLSVITDGRLDFSIFGKLENEKELFLNSLKVAVLSTLISTIASTIIAVFHFIQDEKNKKIISAILMITIISPPFVTALSYINLFGRRGLITYHILHLSTNPYGLSGVVLMQSLGFISMNSLLMIGYLNTLDKSIINSARSLGANTDSCIKDMLIPMMNPVIIVVMLLSFVRSLADFATPSIIGGSFNTLATEGYLSVIAQGDIKKAAAINVIIFLPAIIAFIFYLKSFKNLSTSNHGYTNVNMKLRKKGKIYFLFKILTIFFLAWISLQYFAIILSAFTTMQKGKLIFTLESFKASKPYISKTFLRSIVYSLIAGIAGSFIGHILQYYIWVRKIKLMKVLDFIATMPYIVPGTFFGLGYILAFNHMPLKLTGTASIVILNVLFKQLPFSTKIGYSSISKINYDQIKSIRDLGASHINEITDVVIPMSKDGLYISFVNGFTATMTTIGSIIFLVYPTQKVATLVMFDVIQSGQYDIGSVIALYIIIICLTINLLYYMIIRRKECF